MYALTVTRLLGPLQTERATRVFITAREARAACRRAITPIAGGAQVRVKTRDQHGADWRLLLSHEGERLLAGTYEAWPDRVSFRVRRTIRLAANEPQQEELRLTIEPADARALAWEPFVTDKEDDA